MLLYITISFGLVVSIVDLKLRDPWFNSWWYPLILNERSEKVPARKLKLLAEVAATTGN